MKALVFTNTIGFRLTIWYTILLLVFGILLIISMNLAMQQARRDIPPRFIFGPQSPVEIAEMVGDRYRDYLRLYSLISFGGLVLIGGAGGYFLSKRMLKPVDNVTKLAAQISTTNLKQRINYQGPDDEMKRLADTFDDMLGRLENAFDSQNQFIQDASHELRTPIAIAQTNIDVIEMEKKPTIKDYKYLVEVLKLSMERMGRLSDKLLTLSKGTQESSKFSIINIVPLLTQVVDEFSSNAKKAGLNLQFESTSKELLVRGDNSNLKQAISNVIDNAIRYNRPGGQIDISTQVEKGHLIIQVKDSGIGISQGDQQRVFDRFYRVDKSRSRAQGGSGLGLAIVKKIIEDHMGTITADSTPGIGSTFRISLPLTNSQ